MGSGVQEKKKTVEDDVRSDRPKDATPNENVKVVHTLVMCDRRRDLRNIASEVGSTINPNRHLRYVKGFGKMGVAKSCTQD